MHPYICHGSWMYKSITAEHVRAKWTTLRYLNEQRSTTQVNSAPLYQVDSAPLTQVVGVRLPQVIGLTLYLTVGLRVYIAVGLRLDKRVTCGLTNAISTGQEVRCLRLPRPTGSFVRFILQSFRLPVYQQEKVQPSFRNPSVKLQLNS